MTNSLDKITSKSNPKVKEVCRIKDDPRAELFLLEGKHLADMAYEADCLLEVYSVKEVSYPGVKVTLVSEDVLKKLAVSNSPSLLVGLAKKAEIAPKGKKTLILDRVQDPGNVGTLLRTALAFGYDEVVGLPGTASFYSSKVIAASQGAIFHLSLVEPSDPLIYIRNKKEQGYRIYGSALRNAVNLQDVPPQEGPFALILGNEGRGMDEKLLEECDLVIKIEMEGIESLNVGVAGGILMYRL